MKLPSNTTLRACSKMICMLIFITILSCDKDDSNSVSPVAPVSLEAHYQFLTETTGYGKDEITFDHKKQLFTIHQDMIIAKEEVENYIAKQSTSPNGRTEQRRYTYIVSNAYVTNIKYYLDSTVPVEWRTAIAEAINQWNAINGTKLFLSQVSSSASANVNVRAIYEGGANWVARAALPFSNGSPGSFMEINTYHNSLSAGQKLFAMAHEMGHNFGLLHTNQTDGTIIPGTPETDANSVMNSFVLPWNGFTYYDQVAVQVLYPETSGSITLYQHCDYTGWAASFGVGNYNLAAINAAGGINDDASSVRVPAGLRVTFYEHDNFVGSTLVKTGDDNCFVNEGWNDRISSFRVEPN